MFIFYEIFIKIHDASQWWGYARCKWVPMKMVRMVVMCCSRQEVCNSRFEVFKAVKIRVLLGCDAV